MVVTREPEWDVENRGQALRFAEYEEGICRCGCGQPMAKAHDKTYVGIVDKYTCFAGKALEQVKRKHEDEARDPEGKLPPGYGEGVHYYVTEATEADMAKQKRKAPSGN